MLHSWVLIQKEIAHCDPIQTKMSSPDPKALEKEREDRRRKEKETERRNDLEAMAREKRENDEAAEAKEAQEALRALKERELNADKLRVAAAEAKKTAEDALANLEAAEAAAKAQEGVSAESAVCVVDETGELVSEGKDDAMMVEIANLLKDQTEGSPTDTNKPVDPKPLTRPREGEDDTPSRQGRGETVQGAPKRSLSTRLTFFARLRTDRRRIRVTSGGRIPRRFGSRRRTRRRRW